MKTLSLLLLLLSIPQNFTNQDSLFWFDMNSVLDKPPSAPAVMDGIFGTSQIMVLDSLKNMRKLSNEGFRLQIYETSSKPTADSIVNYFQNLLDHQTLLSVWILEPETTNAFGQQHHYGD